MPVADCRADLAGLDRIVVIIAVTPAPGLAGIPGPVHYFASEYKVEKARSSIQSLIGESGYLVLLAFDIPPYPERLFKY